MQLYLTESVLTSDWTLHDFTTALQHLVSPSNDGQIEVVNRCLETYLSCFSSHMPQGNVQMALYGRAPSTIATYIPRTARLQVVERSCCSLVHNQSQLQFLTCTQFGHLLKICSSARERKFHPKYIFNASNTGYFELGDL